MLWLLSAFTNTGSILDHNLTVNPKTGWDCPNTALNETNAICDAPGLVDESWPLHGYANVTPSSTSSRVSGAGVAIAGLTTDFNGSTRPNPPSIGAVESLGKSVLVSPAPGSTLTSSSATFTWTAGSGVTNNVVYIGSQPGGLDIYSGSPVYGTTSLTVSNLPTDGSTIYVRLWSYVNGGYQYNDYTYTAVAPPASVKSAIVSPAPGSTLTSSSTTFTWTAGTNVINNVVYLGSQPGGADIYSGTPVYGTTSFPASNLPTDGSTIYFRLWSYINGGYQYNDYTYTAASQP